MDLVNVTRDSPPKCWENVGTPESFQFDENPSMLIGVEEPPAGFGIELFDADADNDPDLLITYFPDGNYAYLNERFTPVQVASWSRIKALYRQYGTAGVRLISRDQACPQQGSAVCGSEGLRGPFVPRQTPTDTRQCAGAPGGESRPGSHYNGIHP